MHRKYAAVELMSVAVLFVAADTIDALVWDETIAAFDDGVVKYAIVDSRHSGERGRQTHRPDSIISEHPADEACMTEASPSSPSTILFTSHTKTLSESTDCFSSFQEESQTMDAAASTTCTAASSSQDRAGSDARRQRLMHAAYGNGKRLKSERDHREYA